MSERTCWCGAPIPVTELQCECCRGTPPCKHRRSAQLPGLALPEGYRTVAPDEAHVSEAGRQAQILAALVMAGWRIWRTGQALGSTAAQDAGVPDLVCLKPRWGVAFVEVKRPHGGVMSRAQLEFREACAEAGVRYICASQVADVQPLISP